MNKSITRKKTRSLIVQWFGQMDNKFRVTTDQCVRHVNAYTKPKQDTGTIRREMRFLREDGLINYKTVGEKKDKIIEIIK